VTRLLLDTHILLSLVQGTVFRRSPRLARLLATDAIEAHASVASLWEIAIKTRLGNLDLAVPLEVLAGYCETVGLVILSINRQHAVAWVEPEPATRDPFDRMLLAQCKVEGLRLVTLDHALAEHPLTWRA